MAKSKTRKHGKTKPPKSLEERSLKYSGTRVIRKMLVEAGASGELCSGEGEGELGRSLS